MIRKVVRRAKPGAAWDRALAVDVPALEVAVAGAVAVAAFCPGPIDAVPGDVARLQVSGLDLPRGAVASPGAGALLAVSPFASLSTGKACAQAGHAGQLLYESGPEGAAWVASGAPVAVVCPSGAEWLSLAGSASVVVRDAGLTEVPAGTRTVLAWAPGARSGV